MKRKRSLARSSRHHKNRLCHYSSLVCVVVQDRADRTATTTKKKRGHDSDDQSSTSVAYIFDVSLDTQKKTEALLCAALAWDTHRQMALVGVINIFAFVLSEQNPCRPRRHRPSPNLKGRRDGSCCFCMLNNEDDVIELDNAVSNTRVWICMCIDHQNRKQQQQQQ